MGLSRGLYIAFYVLWLVALSVLVLFLLNFTGTPIWISTLLIVPFAIFAVGLAIKETVMKGYRYIDGTTVYHVSTAWEIFYIIAHVLAFLVLGAGFILIQIHSNIAWWYWTIFGLGIVLTVVATMFFALVPDIKTVGLVLGIIGLLAMVGGLIAILAVSQPPWWVWVLAGITGLLAILFFVFEYVAEDNVSNIGNLPPGGVLPIGANITVSNGTPVYTSYPGVRALTTTQSGYPEYVAMHTGRYGAYGNPEITMIHTEPHAGQRESNLAVARESDYRVPIRNEVEMQSLPPQYGSVATTTQTRNEIEGQQESTGQFPNQVRTTTQTRNEIEGQQFERERLQREQFERERMEQERLQREQLERERMQREQLEQERLSQERLQREQLERERMQREQLERERMQREQLERERMEQERLQREQFERERMQREQLERERMEQERLQRERLEQERLAQERESLQRRELQQVNTATSTSNEVEPSLTPSMLEPSRVNVNTFTQTGNEVERSSMLEPRPYQTLTPTQLERNLPAVPQSRTTTVENTPTYLRGQLPTAPTNTPRSFTIPPPAALPAT